MVLENESAPDFVQKYVITDLRKWEAQNADSGANDCCEFQHLSQVQVAESVFSRTKRPADG